MDPTYTGEMLRHLEKQDELLMDSYRSVSHELHKLQVEEEMLKRKFYDLVAAQGLTKKKQDESEPPQMKALVTSDSNPDSDEKHGGLVPPQSRPGINTMVAPLRPPPPPMQMNYGQQSYMMNRPPPPPMGQPMSVNPPVPPPPGSQFTPLGQRPYMPQHGMPMVAPLPMPQGIPPSLPEEAPPPLPEEPEPKKQRLDDSLLVPEDQFLAQHPGSVRITVLLQGDDEKLKGKSPLEITVSETVGSLKEKIAAEIQLAANKQKLSGKAGFLKDNLSLAYRILMLVEVNHLLSL